MRRLWLIPIVLIVLVVPAAVLASGGEGGFDGVVHSIESRYHTHATRIPFIGLISFVAGKSTHQGVSGLHVAEFESVTEPVDGNELNRMVTEKLGSGWERVIRETSKRGHEQSLIFMHPEGHKMGLFIVDMENHEMDVVQLSVDPDHLSENLGHYQHHHADTDETQMQDDQDSDNKQDNQSTQDTEEKPESK